MDGEFILGMIVGALIVLAVQWYGNRRVKRATRELTDPEARRHLGVLDREVEQRVGQIDRLQDRLATVERIVTDRSHRLGHEIDALR